MFYAMGGEFTVVLSLIFADTFIVAERRRQRYLLYHVG